MEKLEETIVWKNGAFESVRRTWKGWYPELKGAILGFNNDNGQNERVTNQEITLIKPSMILNNDGNL